MAKKVLTHTLSVPLNGTTATKIDIHNGDGNLIINDTTNGELVLASGTMQYLEKQGLPSYSTATSHGKTVLTLRAGGGGQQWLRMPWAACNGATEWHIHLNPTVTYDIKAHSDGGNLQLDLAGMVVTQVKADTGGGNIKVVLPEARTSLNVTVKTGAGNAVINIPDNMAAKIHAASGLGKVIIGPRFSKIDKTTYQSLDYDHAAAKVEINAASGAGNVVIEERISR